MIWPRQLEVLCALTSSRHWALQKLLRSLRKSQILQRSHQNAHKVTLSVRFATNSQKQVRDLRSGSETPIGIDSRCSGKKSLKFKRIRVLFVQLFRRHPSSMTQA